MQDGRAPTIVGPGQRDRARPQHLRRETIGKRGEHCSQMPPGASPPPHKSATGLQQPCQLAEGAEHRPSSAQQADAGVQAASERSWAAADRAEIVVDGLVRAKMGGSDSTVPQAPAHPEHPERSAGHCDSSIGRPLDDRRLCRALAADHKATRSSCHHRYTVRTGQPYREFQVIERLGEHRPWVHSSAAS